MKRLIFAAGLLFSVFSINAVEIVNNTQKTIKFRNFTTIGGIKIMIYPFTLKPGETHKDSYIASCEAEIRHKDNAEEICTLNNPAGQMVTNDIYKLKGFEEQTLVSFVEVNDKIEAHKLDKILPEVETYFYESKKA